VKQEAELGESLRQAIGDQGGRPNFPNFKQGFQIRGAVLTCFKVNNMCYDYESCSHHFMLVCHEFSCSM